jgi:hypothetical protein
MDPFAIQLSQANVTVPNFQAVVYRPNVADLESISRSLNLIGTSMYQYGTIRQRQAALEEQRLRRTESEARQTREALDRAERGAGTEAGRFDAVMLKSGFDDDTLDTTIARAGDPTKGVPPLTVEEQILQFIDEAGGDGPAGITAWTASQLQGPLLQLQSDEARQAYYKEAFTPTVQAGLAWLNRREAARQTMLRSDLASDIAASDASPPSPAELIGITANDQGFEPLNSSQARGVLYEAAETAVAAGRYEHARRILGGIPENQRDAKWYDTFGKGERAFLDSAERVLAREIRSDVFAPEGPLQVMFGPGTEPTDGQVNRLEVALNGLEVDPRFNPARLLRRLQSMQEQVDPFGPAFTLIGERAMRIELAEATEETIKQRRQENDYQGMLTGIRLLSEGAINVTIDGQPTTISKADPGYEQQLRRFFVGKYGEDGYSIYNEFLKLAGSKQYRTEVAEVDQNKAANHLLVTLRSIETVAARRAYLREDVAQAAMAGNITLSQHTSLIAQAGILDDVQPEYDAPVFREARTKLEQAFRAGLGIQPRFDMDLEVVPVNKQVDPNWVRGLNTLLMDFRADYTKWLGTNLSLRTEDPQAFRGAQEQWIAEESANYLERATTDGQFYSEDQYKRRQRPTRSTSQ